MKDNEYPGMPELSPADTDAEEATDLVTVDGAAAGGRIDTFLASSLGVSRSAAARWIEDGCVLVGGVPVAKRYAVREGDTVEVFRPDPAPSEAIPENIPLDIVYEDEDVIVINKPSGMVVHPAAGNPSGTLVNALLYHCGASLSGVGGVVRPGIVHRIDKDTSGLLVCAKNDAAHIALSEQLKTHTVSRVYYAIAVGNFKEDSFTVDLPIGRNPTDRKKMAVYRAGVRDGVRVRDAVTHVTVTERFDGFSFVRCELETGRTHQIRVHLSSVGHPLLGDPLYGGDRTAFGARHKSLIHGQCLHAGELRFRHPRTGEEVHFTCPLPADMQALLEILRKTAT